MIIYFLSYLDAIIPAQISIKNYERWRLFILLINFIYLLYLYLFKQWEMINMGMNGWVLKELDKKGNNPDLISITRKAYNNKKRKKKEQEEKMII